MAVHHHHNSCLGKIIFLLIVGYFAFQYFSNKTVPLNQTTKTCLVTGASSGIGKEIAKEMIKKGWKVIGIARREEFLNEITKELSKDKFIPFVCDVSNTKQVKKTSEEIKSKGLKPTLFYLNAGTGDVEKSNVVSTINHQKVFDTNYFGIVSWIENWFDAAREQGGGTFVATSSVVSLYAPPGSSTYSASKAAINSCFQALRTKHIQNNVGFCYVNVGPVDTAMLKTDKKLPFTQTAKDCAKSIVEGVFSNKRQIETHWFYYIFMRIVNLLPDEWVLKILG